MTANWSQRVAHAYHLDLPPDLASWFNDEIWRSSLGAEFCHPQSVEQLLAPKAGSIWAGFMLPDTLPLIGNEYGDWLCLRVGFDGEITEVVYWCHGGGDWIPYGRTLAEALTYDAAFYVLYDRRFAELERRERSAEELFGAAQWAWPWLREQAPEFPDFWNQPERDNGQLVQELLQGGVAMVAARRDLILRHLESQLKARSQPAMAREFGTPWEPDFVSWLFDSSLVPEMTRDQLSRFFRVPVQQLLVQDWDAAEFEARQVARLRSDLGWPFDILGWAAERRGDATAAIQAYRAGLRASSFSDDSVRFRTHWYAEGYGKFAAARLYALRDRMSVADREDPYLQIFWKNDPSTLRARVRDYWLRLGDKLEDEGRPREAYRHFYSAGWDCGLTDIGGYLEILDRLARAADRGGSPALARIARLHREHLPA